MKQEVCGAGGTAGRLGFLGPKQFFVPPYVGHPGWPDVAVDWKKIAGLIIDAYRVIAPRELVARLEPQEY